LRNRDGSYATQYARERILTMIANQLHETGFRDLGVLSLKPKHVEALAQRWKAESLSAGTIKNRMTELRWWAEKIGKKNVIHRDNDHYGIARRHYVTNLSKSRELTTGDPHADHRSLHGAVAEVAGRLRTTPRGVDQDTAPASRQR
jgi:hypothetical protein